MDRKVDREDLRCGGRWNITRCHAKPDPDSAASGYTTLSDQALMRQCRGFLKQRFGALCLGTHLSGRDLLNSRHDKL